MLQSKKAKRGFTLVEIMVVITIMAFALGGVVLSFQGLARAQLKTASQKLASAIRGLYDRSISTGQYFRLTIDLDKNSYYFERSLQRVVLRRDKQRVAGEEEAARAKRLAAEEVTRKDRARGATGMAADLLPVPKATEGKFSALAKGDSILKRVDLKGVRIRDVYTPRQQEPFKSGIVEIYFFPDGHTERSVIHLRRGDGDEDVDKDSEVYTLIVHPLNGRVEVKKGDIDVPANFDTLDDEGNQESGR